MSDGFLSRIGRTPSPGPQDGCPCEFCEVSRSVMAMVSEHMPQGFAWSIGQAIRSTEEPRAFVVRWGDA